MIFLTGVALIAFSIAIGPRYTQAPFYRARFIAGACSFAAGVACVIVSIAVLIFRFMP